MEKRIPENLMHETKDSPETEARFGFEMESFQAQQIAKELSTFADCINHDKAIDDEDLLDLDIAVRGVIINIGGENMSIEEAENIPDLKVNAKIWEEIKKGSIKNTKYMRFITEEVAIYLGQYKEYLHLEGLDSLPDTAAKHLSNHEGYLDLSGLTDITDKATKYLSSHRGKLDLSGLTSITDETAKYLGKLEGHLNLSSVNSISDEAAKSLSAHIGHLNLDGLKTISDTATEYLVRHKGNLNLHGIISISDKNAEILAKNEEINVGSTKDVSDQMWKYRKKHD